MTMMTYSASAVNYMDKQICWHANFIFNFRAYRTPLYTAHLWCSYSKAKINKIKVAYNDALRKNPVH